MTVTLAVLFAVPLLGVARIDLLGEQHVALGRPVDFLRGLVAVLVAILGFYFVTFSINLPAGRMFCGFGCPLGQLGRFSDAIDAFPRRSRRWWRGWVELVGFAIALCGAVSLWWFAPSTFALAGRGLVASLALVLLVVTAVAHGRLWRWSFCQKVCPIGLYYSVVQSTPILGIDFDPDKTCIDCDACAKICPVGLDPRHLDEPIESPGGLAFDGFPGMNHCLHCGACVDVCEHVTRKQAGPAALGLRLLRRKPRAASAAQTELEAAR